MHRDELLNPLQLPEELMDQAATAISNECWGMIAFRVVSQERKTKAQPLRGIQEGDTLVLFRELIEGYRASDLVLLKSTPNGFAVQGNFTKGMASQFFNFDDGNAFTSHAVFKVEPLGSRDEVLADLHGRIWFT